jgi:O-antigen/teichoic acid export membrane protein
VLVCSLAVISMLTIDNLAVKHYFDAHTAGLYAGVATVARILFFLTASISQTLLASLNLSTPAQNKKAMQKSLLLFLAVGAPVLVVFTLAPQFAVGVLMGDAYSQVAGLLPLLAVSIFTISLLNLVVVYFLALKKYAPGIFVIIGFAATLGFTAVHHASPQAVVESLFVGSQISICLIALWLASAHLVRRGNDETTATIRSGPSAQ